MAGRVQHQLQRRMCRVRTRNFCCCFCFFLHFVFYYLFISIIHVHASTIRLSLYHHLSSLIRTSDEDIINPIQSARMRTINSFSFTYGTVEIRAKMPRGDWIWPGIHFLFVYFFFLFIFLFFVYFFHQNEAMWMMPTENRFGPWPRSGEIDIVEIRANNDFTCRNKQMGNTLMGSTLHFGNVLCCTHSQMVKSSLWEIINVWSRNGRAAQYLATNSLWSVHVFHIWN